MHDALEKISLDCSFAAKDSVYYKVLREASELDKQEVFSDVMSFMFGGHETNSRALSTSLLYLKR